MGSYANQTILEYPHWFVSERKVRSAGIDNCILEEIKDLWASGIQTLESCCGHNLPGVDGSAGYICVVKKDVMAMRALGYKNHNHHQLRGRDDTDQFFYPKSI